MSDINLLPDTISQIIQLRERRVVGLYVCQYPGNRREFKFGESECIQNRTHDAAYTTAVYDNWRFVYFIRKDQDERKNRQKETEMLEFLGKRLEKLVRKKERGEAFQSLRKKAIKLDKIVEIIEAKLGKEYFVYDDQIPKNCKIDNENLLTYSGPYEVDDDNSYTCYECNQTRYRKVYYIVRIDGNNEKIGKDCLEKFRARGYKHENENMEFYQLLEGFPDQDIGVPLTISIDETCRRHLKRIMTSEITPHSLKMYGFCLTDSGLRLCHNHAILALNYCYTKSKVSQIYSSEITTYYTRLGIITFPTMFEYMIKNMDQEIFELSESGSITCIYLDGILKELKAKIDEMAKNAKPLGIKSDVGHLVDEPNDEQKKAKPNDEQKKAIASFIKYPVSILLGGAGTGKGFVIKALYRLLKANDIVCYVTSTSSLVTIHNQEQCSENRKYFNNISRMLVEPHITRSCILIIDELFFADPIKIYFLLEKFKVPLRGLLLVGDLNQIRPINFPNYWFQFMIDSTISHSCLFENVRQKNGLDSFTKHFMPVSYTGNEIAVKDVNVHQTEIIEMADASKIKIDFDPRNSINYIKDAIEKDIKTQFISSTNNDCARINNEFYVLINNTHTCDGEWIDKQGRKYCSQCIKKFEFIITKNVKNDDFRHLNDEKSRKDIENFGFYNGRIIRLDKREDSLRITKRDGSLRIIKRGEYNDISLDVGNKNNIQTREIEHNIGFIKMLIKRCDLRYCLTPEKFQGKQEDTVVVIWNKWFEKDSYKFYSVITRPKTSLIFIMNKSESEISNKSVVKTTVSNFTIDFGAKHKGKTAEYVFEKDPDYVKWILSVLNKSTCPGLKRFGNYCKSRYQESEDS
jgi:hypothetical protein